MQLVNQTILCFVVFFVAGDDFVSVSSEIVFEPDGPVVIYVQIPIIDDEVSEACAETFGVIVSSDDERVNDPPNMIVVIQIDDDDGIIK